MKILKLICFVFISFNFFGQENCETARIKYLTDNPDVKNAGMDPWFHYSTFGQKEGRKWPLCVSSQIQDLDNKKNSQVKRENSYLFNDETKCFSKISEQLIELPKRNSIIDSILNLYAAQFKNSCDNQQALNVYSEFKDLEITLESDIWLSKRLAKTYSLDRLKSESESNNFNICIIRNFFYGKFFLLLYNFDYSNRNDSFGRDILDYQIIDLNQFENPKNKFQEFLWFITQNRNLKIKKIRNEIVSPKPSFSPRRMPLDEFQKNSFLFEITGYNKEFFELKKEKTKNIQILDSLEKNYVRKYYGLNYIGEIKNNQRNGFGILLNKTKDTLAFGYWDKNVLTSKIIQNESSKKLYSLKSSDKLIYPIIFTNVKIETSSTYNDSLITSEKDFMQFFDNGIYIGQKLNGNTLVEGIFFYSNGNVFYGKANLNKSKKGDFYYANGEQYKGELKDISPNGFGTYFYKDKSTFEGNWMDGKRNGSGKFVTANGNVQMGTWSNNEFVIPPEPKQVEVITNYNPVKTTEPNSLSATKSNVKNESSTEKKGFSREELIRRIKYVNNRKKCPICKENYKMCTLKTKQELEREKEIILSAYKDGTLLGFSMFFGVLEGKTYDDAINDALKINKYKCFNVCVECADYFRITRPYDWQTIVKEED